MKLAKGHLLSHKQNDLPILYGGLTQRTAKLVEKACIFTGTAPGDVVRRFAIEKIRQFGRFLAFIEKLVHRNFQSPGHFLQCFDGRNGVTVFHARDIASEESGSLFDCALGEFLFFAECAKAVADNHAGIISLRRMEGKRPQAHFGDGPGNGSSLAYSFT